MSYDLYLRDPVTREELTVPGHMMYGGNIKCDYLDLDGNYVPALTTEAYLNITYNYSHYYYEAFPCSSDDPEKTAQHEKDCARYGIGDEWGGIRVLNGISGADAVPILEEMIRRIETKYKMSDGSWLVTERKREIYIELATGNHVDATQLFVEVFLRLKREGHSDEEVDRILSEGYEKREETYMVDEGSTGESYWSDTAMNAIKPLHQLIALSKMRPDGVWIEES